MTARDVIRKAGGRWRLLVHGRDVSHDVSAANPGQDSEYRQAHHLPRTEFDELVVGSWLHIEQMDTGFWTINIGGVHVHVWADRDGRPKEVMVHGPDDWTPAVKGVHYGLDWTQGEAS